MQIDFGRYYQVVRDGVQEHKGAAVALVGVAILVVHIWGRIAVVAFGLVAFGSYITFGDSWKVMSYVDFKGFLIVSLLLSNGYFGFVNAQLLNYYAGACMAVREWNFWGIHSQLSKQCDQLSNHNASMEKMLQDWKDKIESIEKQFKILVEQAAGVVPAQEQLEEEKNALQSRVEQNFSDITGRLNVLSELAQTIMSSEALMKKVDQAAGLRKDVASLEKQKEITTQKFKTCTEELQSLNQQLEKSLKVLGAQEATKSQQIQILTTVIQSLRNLQGGFL